jgi:hypothetical protein
MLLMVGMRHRARSAVYRQLENSGISDSVESEPDATVQT